MLRLIFKKTLIKPEIIKQYKQSKPSKPSKPISEQIYRANDYKNIPPCEIMGYDYDLMAQQYAPHCK